MHEATRFIVELLVKTQLLDTHSYQTFWDCMAFSSTGMNCAYSSKREGHDSQSQNTKKKIAQDQEIEIPTYRYNKVCSV